MAETQTVWPFVGLRQEASRALSAHGWCHSGSLMSVVDYGSVNEFDVVTLSCIHAASFCTPEIGVV